MHHQPTTTASTNDVTGRAQRRPVDDEYYCGFDRRENEAAIILLFIETITALARAKLT
jgi:hypothetical protein